MNDSNVPALSLGSLGQLFRHMEWADAMVWTAVLATDPGGPDSRLREDLFHVHATQRAFLSVWLDEPVDYGNASEFETLPALRTWAREFYPSAESFRAQVIEADLVKPVSVPWTHYFSERIGREAAVPMLADTLYQVVAHTTYHRGQVNRRIRELGGEPPLVDYIAWIWSGKPEPEWSD